VLPHVLVVALAAAQVLCCAHHSQRIKLTIPTPSTHSNAAAAIRAIQQQQPLPQPAGEAWDPLIALEHAPEDAIALATRTALPDEPRQSYGGAAAAGPSANDLIAGGDGLAARPFGPWLPRRGGALRLRRGSDDGDGCWREGGSEGEEDGAGDRCQSEQQLTPAEQEARAAAAAAARRAFANAGAFFAEISAAQQNPNDAADAAAEAQCSPSKPAAATIAAAPEGAVAAAAAAFDQGSRSARRRRRSFSSITGGSGALPRDSEAGDLASDDARTAAAAVRRVSGGGRAAAFTAARVMFQSAEPVAALRGAAAAAVAAGGADASQAAADTATAAATARIRRYRRSDSGRYSSPSTAADSAAADPHRAAAMSDADRVGAASGEVRCQQDRQHAAGAAAEEARAAAPARSSEPAAAAFAGDDAASGFAALPRAITEQRARSRFGSLSSAGDAPGTGSSVLDQLVSPTKRWQFSPPGQPADLSAAAAGSGDAAGHDLEGGDSAGKSPGVEPFVFGAMSQRQAAMLKLQSQLQDDSRRPPQPGRPPAAFRSSAAAKAAAAAADSPAPHSDDAVPLTGDDIADHPAWAAVSGAGGPAQLPGAAAAGYARSGGDRSETSSQQSNKGLSWYGRDGAFFSQRRMRRFHRHQQQPATHGAGTAHQRAVARRRGAAAWLPQLFAVGVPAPDAASAE